MTVQSVGGHVEATWKIDVLEEPTCGALRPALRDAGWECNGVGLIVVSTFRSCTGDPDVPIVLPRRALEIVDPEDWWESIREFTGGDHFHLVVSRRPPESSR